MIKPTGAATTPPAPAEPETAAWPEIVFPEPGDGERLVVTTLEGVILVISRDHYEPGD